MKAIPVSLSSGVDSDVDLSSEHGDLPSLAESSRSLHSALGPHFLLSRRWFSQLGFTGWDKRSTVDVLQKDERLLRELKHLDSQVRKFIYYCMLFAIVFFKKELNFAVIFLEMSRNPQNSSNLRRRRSGRQALHSVKYRRKRNIRRLRCR
jgi:hypothetical protein